MPTPSTSTPIPRRQTLVPATLAPAVASPHEMEETATSGEPLETISGDRFILLNQIGEGGNAVVWRARDREMRTTVAVKILRSSDPDRQRRFAQEAEVLANIRHVNVVRAFSRGVTSKGRPYVVLELFSGQSLRARLDTSGPLPWREVLEIGIQAAAALDALHGRGVIHRDLKPGNIMSTTDDAGSLVVKVIDFGVARLNDGWEVAVEGITPQPPRRRTDVGVAIGTPGYMPLEAGLSPPDERFDVYGLGATLYELCTGKLPGLGPVGPLHEVEPTCDAPADLAVVLAAALALEPGDRTQTAGEFGRALAAVRAAHPEHATSPLFDGRYERIAVMGTGGKAEVFHANHRGSGHDVALKLLRSTSADEAARFRREAHLLALFEHSCIPRFYDYAPNADPPYIAMARAPGAAAAKFCRRDDAGRLSPVEVAQVGWQLAGALAYLHERGVLHRDVNANNVIIDLPVTPLHGSRIAQSRNPRATLVDLGCAELTEKFYALAAYRYLTPPEFRVEIPDGGIHTLPWAAPEARAGHGFTDKSDVYSLALLLFRLLTGKPPTNKGQIEPVSPRAYVPHCPDDIASAILAALSPTPEHRLTAAQLMARFEEALADTDDVPPPPAPPLALVLPLRPSQAAAPVDTAPKGWTRFMEATAEHSGARGSAASGPPGAADSEPARILPLHPRDILERATTLEPGFLPAVEAKRPRPRARTAAIGAAATLMLVAAGLTFWTTRPATISISEENIPPVSAIAEPSGVPASVSVDKAPPLAVVRTISAEKALADVSEALTTCATQARRTVFVEVTTSPGEPHFTAIDILCDSPEGTSCARRILDELRFEPPTVTDTFIKEYRP